MRRRGFTYLEVAVASIVFALTLAGLGATIVAQERLMQAVERRVVVLAPPGVEVSIDQFVAPNSYTASRALAHTGGDIFERTDAWAARLGSASMRGADGRRGRLPPPMTTSGWALDTGLSWVPPGLPDPPPADRLYTLDLRSLVDDGTTSAAVVDLDEVP